MKKSILKYLIPTYLFSWLLWGFVAIFANLHIISEGAPAFMIPYILGGLSPAIWGIFAMRKSVGKEEFRTFAKSICHPKSTVFKYLFVIAASFAFCFLPTLWGGASQRQPLYMAAALFPVMIIGGGLEEIGWRGFLQPMLQKKFSPTISALIVAPVWALWHLPLFFIPGTNQYGWGFLAFFLVVVGLSLLLSAVYSVTKSIFMCIVFHALIDAFWEIYVPDMGLLSGVLLLAFSAALFFTVIYVLKTRAKQPAPGSLKI